MDLLAVRDSSWGPAPGSHLHLIPLLIIGQDLGHIPVPGGDGLDIVIAAVGLKYRQDVRKETLGSSFGASFWSLSKWVHIHPFLLLFGVAWLEFSNLCDAHSLT